MGEIRVLKRQNAKLVLKAESGLSVGNIYPLKQSRNVIGRSVEAMVPVDDVKVSRNHAAIDNRNGFYYVVDLGSTNGTYMNGRKLELSEMLSPGDEIRVGSTVFKVEILDRAKSQMADYWSEATSVIQLPKALASESRPPLPPGPIEGSKKVESLEERRLRLVVLRKKIALAVLSVALILGALGVGFRH